MPNLPKIQHTLKTRSVSLCFLGILLLIYLVTALRWGSFHTNYSTADDQFTNINYGYNMTRGRFLLDTSHPVGTQSLYAIIYLLSGRDYQFNQDRHTPGRWYYEQGLAWGKGLNHCLVFLILYFSYRLLIRWQVPKSYAIPLLVMFAFNPYLLLHSSYALSTIPYAFFLSLAFYNYEMRTLNRDWWLVGICIGLPYYFKFNGLILIYVFSFCLFIEVLRKKLHWHKALLIILIAVLTITPRLLLRKRFVGNAFYHLSMHNVWMDRRDKDSYQDFYAKYGLNMKTLEGYQVLRREYFKNHTFDQMLKRGLKGVALMTLTILPSLFGGALIFILALAGFFLAASKRVFIPLLLFLTIAISGLSWLAKAGPPPLYRWSQFVPLLTFPFLGIALSRIRSKKPWLSQLLLIILLINGALFNYQSYAQINKVTLAVERVPALVNYAPYLLQWGFDETEIQRGWQIANASLSQTSEEGLSFVSGGEQTRLTKSEINLSSLLVNYIETTIRVDQSDKPVKGKLYFTTNLEPNWSEKRVSRILMKNDGQFHTYSFFVGGYFSLKKGEQLTKILFQPSMGPNRKLTLQSIKIRF